MHWMAVRVADRAMTHKHLLRGLLVRAVTVIAVSSTRTSYIGCAGSGGCFGYTSFFVCIYHFEI